MKKIFLCITKSNWGGAQKYVYDLAVSLPKDEFDVSVLAGGNGELFVKLQEKNIKIFPIKHSLRDNNILGDIALFFELLFIFKRGKPDIVHLNSSKMGALGAISARFVGIKKIIFTAHGWAFNEERNFFSRWFLWMAQMKTVILSHTTICVSKAVQRQIPKILNKRSIVVYNGIEQIECTTKTEARKIIFDKIRSGKSLGESILQKRWVSTIAELHKNKGLKYAVHAFSHIDDSSVYIIIGEGEERKNIESQIKKFGLEGIVFLAGKIDNASSLLKAFDIFLLPSITEALPYCLLEAGSVGLPIVATNVGGVSEIIENNVSGVLITPKSSEEIANIIIRLNNGSNTNDFGSAIQKTIEAKFNNDIMIERTIEIYKFNN